MGVMNAIACTVPTTADLIVALADTAALLRDVRVLTLPMPLACVGGHPPSRFLRWDDGLMCCACGTRPMPADVLHKLLTAALRQRVLIHPLEVAA